MSAPFTAKQLLQMVAKREITSIEAGIILALMDSPAGLSAKDLAEQLHSTPNSINVIVCRARAKGLPLLPARRDGAGSRKVDGVRVERYRLGSVL